jgi:hypothetical protein
MARRYLSDVSTFEKANGFFLGRRFFIWLYASQKRPEMGYGRVRESGGGRLT